MLRKNSLLFLVSCFLFCSFCTKTLANDDAIIEKIEYKYDGDAYVSQDFVDSRVQLKVGEEFSQFLADSSVKSLYSSGAFDNIVVKANENPDTKNCVVTFFLTPRSKITEINFVGNSKIKKKTLKKKISMSVGSRLSDSALRADTESLIRFYNDKGYPYANVTTRVEHDKDSFGSKVFFDISEGEKFKVGKIRFIGNDVVKSSDLLDLMRTKEWRIWHIFGRAGVYRSSEFKADLGDLRAKFRDCGFLDVEIDEDSVVYTKKNGKICIDIPVNLGERYYIGSIVIKGNTIYSVDKITELLTIKQGDIFSTSAIDNSIGNVHDLYGRGGYVDTVVVAKRKPKLNSDIINLVFEISESSKYFVNDIEVHGNSKTKSKVILRELALAPGDPLDTVRMNVSRERLMGTGFFSAASITPVDSDVPNKKDLIVDVKEADTGKASIGGGVSTGGEVVGTLEFSQRNFDLKSKNKKFQGGGQKFRAGVQVGRHTQAVDINFEEPWFYDRELAVGVDLFFQRTNFSKSLHDYIGASYDEKRIGAEIYARKRLFELWIGKLAYHIENVNIRNISRNAPRCFFDEEGNTSVSKVIFTADRDTRDDIIHPTSGSNIVVSTELAGGPFFGETKYFKASSSASRHWLVFNEPEQVFSVLGEAGSITPYGGDTVPFFDRFYLGGSRRMKGFKSRDIGPNERGTGIGGNTFAYATAEYSVRVFDPFRVYGFAEVGILNESKWNFSTKRYNTDIGFGFKIDIMKWPLNLSFGFPVHGERNNKHGMRFNFSFGGTF